MGTIGSQPDALYRCTTTGATRQWIAQSVVVGKTPTTCNVNNAGRLYWDSADGTLKVCNGTTSFTLGNSSAITLGTATGATNPQISGDATSGFYTSGPAAIDVAINGVSVAEWNSSGYNLMQAASGLRLGGQSGFRYPADIAGTGYTIAIGRNALVNAPSPTWTNSGNVAIGGEALAGVLTGNAGMNVALGFSALNANTDGSDNVAIGSYALSANTTAQFATAVGYQALSASATGGGTAVGYRAMGNATAGGTALGLQALQNNSGNYNVAVGWDALMTNTAGNANIAIGDTALAANTTGSTNVGIGYQALYSSITGSDNIAIGGNALFSNTSGANNLALGSSALSAITTATGNTAIGYNAGNTITSGSNNIAIGANAQVVSATGSNQVSIGNLIYGDISATKATVSASVSGGGLRVTNGTNAIGTITNAGGHGRLSIFDSNGTTYISLGPWNPSSRNFMALGSNLALGSNSTAAKSLFDVFGNVTIGSYAGVNAAPSNGLIVSGQVGIATASPQATLDVNGYIRLLKNSAQPVACSATNDGATALTSQYTLCICKGGATNWVKSTDGSTACSW